MEKEFKQQFLPILAIPNICLFQNILQLKALNQQLDEKNIEIRDIRAQVQKNNDKIHSLEKSAGLALFSLTF